jgi:hypothetical protein
VIILDENIFADQRELLHDRKITSRQIGVDLEEKGLSDEEIVTLLHRIVWLDVRPAEVADYAWRFLRHASFRSHKQRLGTVVRVSPKGIVFWQQNKQKLLDW